MEKIYWKGLKSETKSSAKYVKKLKFKIPSRLRAYI